VGTAAVAAERWLCGLAFGGDWRQCIDGGILLYVLNLLIDNKTR
jgi:hypothetical protein